jgi:glycosyltransferase involved in cell wall biosynthesis
MPDPQVSIVVTCYNDGQFLPDALGSLKDSLVPLEVIVIDGGSTDPATLAYLETLKGDAGLTFVRLEKSTLSQARNAGIALARTPYVVPLDADNRLSMPGLKQALAIMVADDRIGVVHGDAEVFGLRTYTWRNEPLDFNALVVSNTIDACVLLNKAAWTDVGGYSSDPKIKCMEDWILWLGLLNRGWKFAYTGGRFFDYRLREGSMSKMDGSNMRRVNYAFMAAYKLQTSLVAKLVAEKTLNEAQGRDLLGRVELRVAYTNLVYGNLFTGLHVWLLALIHVPLRLREHIRILLLFPVKRVVLDLFGKDLRHRRDGDPKDLTA